jgi:hypothetical protein
MTNAALRLQPIVSHLRLIMTDPTDERRDTPTIEAPPPASSSEPTTSPVASERPAIAPPARLPDAEELGSTALASTEPPEWFKASFIGHALTKFADDARDIRQGRERQHVAQMAKLGELKTDYEMLRRELKSFRDSSQAKDADHDARLAEGDERFAQIENSIETLKAELMTMVKNATDDAARRIGVLERELKDLRADARSTPTPAASTG